jgi:NADH-quinone oxidoreductase subunit H
MNFSDMFYDLICFVKFNHFSYQKLIWFFQKSIVLIDFDLLVDFSGNDLNSLSSNDFNLLYLFRIFSFVDICYLNFLSILSSLVISLLIIIPILLGVAYTTLLERKVMAAMQRRLGPNVVGYLGLLQPLADGLKLLLKEPIIPRKSNKFLFIFSPCLVLFLSLFGWLFLPLDKISFLVPDLNLLYLISINVLEIYGILFAGWASNSKYALLGALRSGAQMISYELSMSFIYLIFIFIVGSFNFKTIVQFQEMYSIWFIVPLLPIALMFFISILAETNRTPFDLPEAEAELVAGYNVEYSGILFAFFFLGEYSNMLFLSSVYVLLFFAGWAQGLLFLSIKIIFVLFLFIWVRATFPRYRYDQLMALGWKLFLPYLLSYLVFLVISAYFFEVLAVIDMPFFIYSIWPMLDQ